MATDDYTLTGMLTFDAQDDSGTHAVTYSLKGSTTGAAFRVYPVKWETPAPARHMVMTRSGAYDVNSWFGLTGDLNGQYVNGQWKSSGTISGIDLGIVINPACTFSAKRSKAESANIDPHIAAQKEGTLGPARAILGPNASGAGWPVTGAPTAAGAGTPQPAPQVQTVRTILYFCSAYFGPNGENMAFSDSFEAPEQTDINSVRDDFVRFVREKYSPHDSNNGGCQGADNKAKVKEESATREHRKIIETGWKPVASGKGKPYYCFGYNANKVLYFSDTFEVPPDTPPDPTREDFARFVTRKYGLDPGRNGEGSWEGGVMCLWGDKSKHNNEMGYKIIETGWKPKSLPPPGH